MKGRSKGTIRLRVNRNNKSWKVRVSIARKGEVNQRVEVGLKTQDEVEAKKRAQIVIRAFEAAGIHAKPPLRVSGYYLAPPRIVDRGDGFQLRLGI